MGRAIKTFDPENICGEEMRRGGICHRPPIHAGNHRTEAAVRRERKKKRDDYAADPVAANARALEYLAAHRDHINATRRAWSASHPENMRVKRAKARIYTAHLTLERLESEVE